MDSLNRPLSPALRGDKNALSPRAYKEIQLLRGPQPRAFLRQAVSAWGVIIATITLAVHIDSFWASLFAILIVATRFNILGLLIHEQVHFLGFRGPWGDNIANLLAAYPIGITVEDYAKVHLSHHKNYFTEEDPDFLRKSGVDWVFPMPFKHLAKLLLSDITSLSFLKLFKGKQFYNKNVYNRPYPTPKWLRFAFYAIVASSLTIFQMWSIFLVYWVLPLLTVLPLIVRLGAICEHIYNLPKASLVESSPLIILRWWEKLVLPNLNFTYHTYHHFFPGIAYCHLPKVHEIFKRENLVNEEAVFYGYWSYLKYLQKTPADNSELSLARNHSKSLDHSHIIKDWGRQRHTQ